MKTYAIFSDGERHGTSSSSSSSLSSHSSPSSLPDMLNDDDVNISGTGNIDGRLLPEIFFFVWKTNKHYSQMCVFMKRLCLFAIEIWKKTLHFPKFKRKKLKIEKKLNCPNVYLVVDLECLDLISLDYSMVFLNDLRVVLNVVQQLNCLFLDLYINIHFNLLFFCVCWNGISWCITSKHTS